MLKKTALFSGDGFPKWVSKLHFFATALTTSAAQPLCFLSFCGRLWCRLKHLQNNTYMTILKDLVHIDCCWQYVQNISSSDSESWHNLFICILFWSSKTQIIVESGFLGGCQSCRKVTLERTSGSATTSQRLFLRQFAPMRWDVFGPHCLLKPNQQSSVIFDDLMTWQAIHLLQQRY